MRGSELGLTEAIQGAREGINVSARHDRACAGPPRRVLLRRGGPRRATTSAAMTGSGDAFVNPSSAPRVSRWTHVNRIGPVIQHEFSSERCCGLRDKASGNGRKRG